MYTVSFYLPLVVVFLGLVRNSCLREAILLLLLGCLFNAIVTFDSLSGVYFRMHRLSCSE